MIKASIVKPNGTTLLILGLEGENMARLMSDEPIVISVEQIRQLLGVAGPPMPDFEIAIIGGADADALKAQLAPHIGPNTVVHEP